MADARTCHASPAGAMLPAHPVGALESNMNLSVDQRDTLSRWLPTVLVVAAVWLLARGLKRSFWAVFGLGWVMHWSDGRLPFWF